MNIEDECLFPVEEMESIGTIIFTTVKVNVDLIYLVLGDLEGQNLWNDAVYAQFLRLLFSQWPKMATVPEREMNQLARERTETGICFEVPQCSVGY